MQLIFNSAIAGMDNLMSVPQDAVFDKKVGKLPIFGLNWQVSSYFLELLENAGQILIIKKCIFYSQQDLVILKQHLTHLLWLENNAYLDSGYAGLR